MLQGLTLGPTLLLLYDLVDYMNCSHTILFSDDINLFYKCSNIGLEASVINKGLMSVRTWCSLNKVDKTNFIVIKNWQNKLNLIKALHISNKNIATTADINFLA